MAGCMEGIHRALLLGLVLIAGTAIEHAPSVGSRGLSNASEYVCSVKTIWLKLFPKLPFVTQCLTQVEIIEVHWTVMACYLLNLI